MTLNNGIGYFCPSQPEGMGDVPIADLGGVADNVDRLAELDLLFDFEVELGGEGGLVLEHGYGETFK